MPRLIPHIDAIAREKERDVLFVHFEHYQHHSPENHSAREQLMAWLDEQNIDYMPCMGLENPNVIESYQGDLYLDVPFDISDSLFQILSMHLEDEEGNMKIDGALFFTLSLELALEVEAEREGGIFDALEEDDWDGKMS